MSSLATGGHAQTCSTWSGSQDSLVAVVLLKVLSVALALLADTVLFAILLSRLSGAHLPWRQVRSGALLGAVGFELLKLVGTFLIAGRRRTRSTRRSASWSGCWSGSTWCPGC